MNICMEILYGNFQQYSETLTKVSGRVLIWDFVENSENVIFSYSIDLAFAVKKHKDIINIPLNLEFKKKIISGLSW